MDHYAGAYRIFIRIRGYRGLEEMLYSLRHFSRSDVAQQRMKIIEFYKSYEFRQDTESASPLTVDIFSASV